MVYSFQPLTVDVSRSQSCHIRSHQLLENAIYFDFEQYSIIWLFFYVKVYWTVMMSWVEMTSYHWLCLLRDFGSRTGCMSVHVSSSWRPCTTWKKLSDHIAEQYTQKCFYSFLFIQSIQLVLGKTWVWHTVWKRAAFVDMGVLCERAHSSSWNAIFCFPSSSSGVSFKQNINYFPFLPIATT